MKCEDCGLENAHDHSIIHVCGDCGKVDIFPEEHEKTCDPEFEEQRRHY